MTKMHPTEGDVKTAVKRLLSKAGWMFFMPAANAYGLNGISDILCLKAGRFLAIETKLKKKTGSALQDEFGEKVRANGGIYRVVNKPAIDSGEFETWLHGLDS